MNRTLFCINPAISFVCSTVTHGISALSVNWISLMFFKVVCWWAFRYWTSHGWVRSQDGTAKLALPSETQGRGCVCVSTHNFNSCRLSVWLSVDYVRGCPIVVPLSMKMLVVTGSGATYIHTMYIYNISWLDLYSSIATLCIVQGRIRERALFHWLLSLQQTCFSSDMNITFNY